MFIFGIGFNGCFVTGEHGVTVMTFLVVWPPEVRLNRVASIRQDATISEIPVLYYESLETTPTLPRRD
jgi:hypothetical protein